MLLGGKAMTNLDNVLKSRDITLPTKAHLFKAMVFPVVMFGCESWTIKKAEHRRTDAFELCWRESLESLEQKSSNQSILKEINPEYSLEGLILKLELQCFGHLMGRADSLEKTLMLEMTEGRRSRGLQRMRWLDGTTDSMNVSLTKLQEMVENREFGHAAVHEVPESYMTWQLYNHMYKYHREGNGNPLQYSCLENPMDRGGTGQAFHGATSQTWLSD